MQVVHDILNKEGPRGLFRGLGATMVTVPLFWGVYFPLYEETKHYVSKSYPHAHPSLVHCGSAVFTGAVADVLCNPLFVIRTRLQTQALHQTIESASSSTSPIQMPSSTPTKTTMATPTMRHTALDLYQTHGPTVFWRGMSANLMGLSHVAIQFPTYEFLKSMAQNSHPTEPESAWELLLASGLAKLCASLISYPHEVLRSRMMDSRATIPPTLIGTARDIWTIEGPKGFYRGLPITLFRVLPNCCITFVSYEYLKRWSQDHYHKWQEQKQQQRHQQQ
jgi:solute carrier family 25 folate transporter 32